jgi:hypothetical protein
MQLAADCTISTRNAYLEFLEHLNGIGVRYAVLHGWELLSVGHVSDLDLVVDACDLLLFEASLHERYQVLSMLQYEATGFAFVLLPKDSDTVTPFNVDVITDYRWRGRIFLTDKELLEQRYQWRGFWVVGMEEEFLYLLIKKIYDKGTIPEGQRTRLQVLKGQLGPTASAALRRYFGRSSGEQLSALLLVGDWQEIETHIGELRSALGWTTLMGGIFASLRYWLAESHRLWSRWWHPTGLSIAVMGATPAQCQELAAAIMSEYSRVFRRTVIYSDCSVRRFFSQLLTAHRVVVRSGLVLFNLGKTSWYFAGETGRRLVGRLLPKPEILLIFDGHMWRSRELRTPPGGWEHPSAACVPLGRYLTRRYMVRRHLWFPVQ